jgi:enoyl-CoA hydratase/carnithine racemase
MSELVTSELSGGVLRLVMQRPDKKNALTQDMYATLADGLESAAGSSDIRAIHITGAGDAFTAGNDIADFVTQAGAESEPPVFRFLKALPQVEVPVVAAVNGLAIGVGVTMLLHCDFVYASDNALFTTPFIDLALVPEAASSLLMPEQLGYLAAARMLLLGEKLDAAQARDCGLVTEVVPAAALLEKSLAVAESLAKKPPAALRACKRLMRRQPEPVLERMECEFSEFGAALNSPEAAEAIAAFFEKRAPDYSRFD